MSKRMWVGLIGAGLMMMIGLAFGLFSVTWAQSTTDVETMTRANQLYESGRFLEAAQTYQQLADKGIADSTLYYNLGNAYYKQGQLGQAILNYERAAQMKPRDGDIRANLEKARGEIVDKYESDNSGWLGRFVAASQSWLTMNEMALISLSFWLLLAALILLYRHTRLEAAQYALILVGLLFMISLWSLGSRIYVENSRPQAIILAEEVDVLSGPGTQYITEFNLHSGAKVSLLETRGTWARLALPGDQMQGWLRENAMEIISP